MFNDKDRADFEAEIAALGLRYFKPYELLEKGAQHGNPNAYGYNLNDDPPRELWPNIKHTAVVLDELRHRLKSPIRISSVYRTVAYNMKVGGEKKSLHIQFNAIDFAARGSSMSPQDWASVLRQMRQEGLFRGGIGVYATFVHVDTRGSNADWVL